MTTSGTTTFQNTFDILEIIEEAYEIIGKELRSGYDLKTARRSLNLLTKEWGNRGINFWTIAETSTAVAANTSSVTLNSSTLDVLDAVWRTGSGASQSDRMLTRMSVTDWSETANKNNTGQPSRYWVNRTEPATMQLWPVPSAAGTLVYWRLRRMEDVGAYSNTMDVPPRFLPALTTGLAYYLALKNTGATERLPLIQAEYERQFNLAAEEDRDRTSLFLVPGDWQ